MACTKFQQLIIEGIDVNPFAVSCSIASLCVFIYKLKFMPVDEHGVSRISLLPEHDLRAQGLAVQSNLALKWISWLRHTTGLPIQSALTGHEPIVGKFFCKKSHELQYIIFVGNRSVDGLYIESTQQEPEIFQFHG